MPTMNPNFVAGGNITQARFVTQQTDADATVEQSGTDEMPVGVSGLGTKYPPIPSVTNTYLAEEGDPVLVHGIGETCFLEAGGIVTAGSLCKPDSVGRGVTATAGDKYGARALTAAGAAGERLKVFVERGVMDI